MWFVILLLLLTNSFRSKEQQDLSISEGEIDKCSHNVEGEMFSFFGDTGHRYKNKYRSLMFNLKDPRNKASYCTSTDAPCTV